MADNRKYYYLKLKENFFDSDSIVLLEDMKDGVLYSNILLKLYLKSLKNGGRLQLDEHIPYTAQMIATLTRHQIGTVERALAIFQQLGLVEQLDCGLLYMTDIELMIGQSSTEAERKRAARLENKALLPPRTNGGHLSDIRPPEIEIKKEIDIELEKEGELKGQALARSYGRYENVFLTDTELSELQAELPEKWAYYIERLSGYIASTGKKYKNHAATIRRWAADDTAKAAPKKGILHIHPLCVPKVYTYDAIDEKVEISPANEGGLFSTYSKIIERLNEHPSSFSHTGTYFHTPLKKSTYDSLLNKADWLVILDQSLKSWDASLRAASEKLYYKENSYRSIGIYSNNSLKFIRGYDTLVKDLGNYLPKEKGIQEIIEATREVNDEGLLSIISHSTNKIFDQNHGKGSLGSAIAAIIYKGKNPNSILVGLDTQLAKEWLSERDDGHLPDLIGINLSDESQSDVTVDIIEVKTYKAFEIDEGHKTIKGDAVNQVSVIEALILEMFSKTEKITTVSRREILREQVYDALFQASFSPKIKREYVVQLNDLFAGKLSVCINMNIYYVNFNEELSAYKQLYKGAGCYKGKNYYLTTLGSQIIQAIVSNSSFSLSMLEEKEAQTTIQLNQANYENNSTIADEADEIEKKAKKTQSPSESDIKESNQAELDKKANHRILEEKCARMNKVLRDFNIHAFPVTVDKVQEATRFTRFKIELKSGETIRSLLKAKEDIGIQLEANGEILIEHIKGTKYISVDVPFVTNNSIISLNEHLELLKSTSGYLNVIAGQAPDGSFEIIDIADAPHMLIAGTTGSGKTVFLQSILVSLLKQFSKDELEVLIIDPKQTDFVFFEDIPHLYGGNIVVDAEEALEKITQINEKDKEVRTKALRSCKSKNIESYNSKNPDNKLKRLVVIIDEYSDLIQAAEMLGTRKEFEKTLLMLLQRVRSLGIHFIIATQRPSAQIVTGALKAVIPFRVSFRLPSHTDSQTILDMSGAENLLGKGDMLMVTETDTKRLQGLYITENELEEFLSTL